MMNFDDPGSKNDSLSMLSAATRSCAILSKSIVTAEHITIVCCSPDMT
jgi:hypothetical protein